MLLFSMMLFIREFTVSAFQRVRSHEPSIESVASILRREERERERESHGYKRITFDRAGDLSASVIYSGSDRIPRQVSPR